MGRSKKLGQGWGSDGVRIGYKRVAIASDTESGCQTSMKTHSVQPGGYTDKARLRGLRKKPTFDTRIWYDRGKGQFFEEIKRRSR
ncbi:hypothetical protein [Laspinema olomoucense]|uniref:Uncharacterized protein n=1 Tax=Laspinema olomoucense D3b TaxID=2953688 RepID=A0ABT2NHW8_9CYAN|nr:hypothetical protein [Laspinema sp. D3b]MCT7981479.1 hypothetical protein [Laspinema sp. D3b]